MLIFGATLMKYLKKFIQYIYCIYALIGFILIMFVVVPFVAIFSMFGIRGGNFIYRACNIWARVWYFMIGIRHKAIFEAPHNNHGHYIFVANHCSYMDIPAVVRTIQQPVRVLGKSEMLKYPIFGIIYKAAVIVVDRSSAEKRAKSVRALKAALNKTISIFIFPEGTFNESDQPLKEFYDGAFRVAIETRTPIKPLIFVDTLERMHWRSIFELTPGRSAVVYLEEIPVDQYTMKDVQRLKKLVYERMEHALIKYKPALYAQVKPASAAAN